MQLLLMTSHHKHYHHKEQIITYHILQHFHKVHSVTTDLADENVRLHKMHLYGPVHLIYFACSSKCNDTFSLPILLLILLERRACSRLLTVNMLHKLLT